MSPADVVGRSDEVAQLTATTGRALGGRGQAVLVEGEPGIGKTTILNVVALECQRLGARVLRGKADDLDRRLPFAAIGTCLGVTASAADPDLARVAGLIRGEYEAKAAAAVAAADLEFLVTEAILDLVDKWCGAGPVALLLDDLQWADPPSLLVLHRLGAAIGEMPLLVVGAAQAYRTAGRPLFEGNAMEIAAALHADVGQATEARTALDAAIEIYERLDATWDAERAAALLAEKGVRRGKRGRRHPTRGWESLSDIERRVAALVAEGRTNPEIASEVFLSRRTVQHHVSNALAKLGLSSRIELAVAADRSEQPRGVEVDKA